MVSGNPMLVLSKAFEQPIVISTNELSPQLEKGITNEPI